MEERERILRLYNELIKSPLHVFPTKGKVVVSSKHGVYIVYGENNKVLHVGMTPMAKMVWINDYITTLPKQEYFIGNIYNLKIFVWEVRENLGI